MKIRNGLLFAVLFLFAVVFAGCGGGGGGGGSSSGGGSGPSGAWNIAVIDDTVTETLEGETSITLDQNSKVHISYAGSLKYATNASGSWVTSDIDNIGLVGYDNSIVTDSGNKVHIGYAYESDNDLKYATNESGGWVTSIIDSGVGGGYASIAIDSNEKLHMSYWAFMDFWNGPVNSLPPVSG